MGQYPKLALIKDKFMIVIDNMVNDIKKQILGEYPELELTKNEPVTVTDGMWRVAWSLTPRWLFDEVINELFSRNISNFFWLNQNEMFFVPSVPEGDGIRKYTSVCLARKVGADRIAQCFTLACWGPAFDFEAIGRMIEDVTALKPKIAALDDRYGRSLLRTVVGDRYAFTHAVTIEPAFPTEYLRQLDRLGYDIYYISSEQEQLDSLKTFAEDKTEEALKDTCY
ncbi:MAG TPA: hypothetical protein HA262_11100 [Methanosarcina sp.]|nr:hypothetical protein [Methanosarcina sp.]